MRRTRWGGGTRKTWPGDGTIDVVPCIAWQRIEGKHVKELMK
jgi:hypothetical protein